jgi:predicted kinase
VSGLPAVLLSGAPASGKSTLARLIARQIRAAVIDQDVATGPLVSVVQRLIGVDDLDDPRLAGLTREPRYRVLLDLAVDNLFAGTPVVLVAPFTAERSQPAAWSATHDRLTTAGGTPLMVWLRLEPAEVVRRLRARGAARDAAKLTDEAAYLARMSTACSPPVVPHLALDATLPPEVLAGTVLDALPSVPNVPYRSKFRRFFER